MGAAEARPSLHLSKCHIVGNLMPRLIMRLVPKSHVQAHLPSGASEVPGPNCPNNETPGTCCDGTSCAETLEVITSRASPTRTKNILGIA